MYYAGWGRKLFFRNYQEQTREQDDTWVVKLPKDQGQDCRATQKLPCG